MLEQRKLEVQRRVKELKDLAEGLYNIKLPEVEIDFTLRGRVAGYACHDGRGRYALRFNVDMMQNESWQHILMETIPHEVGHLVCQSHPHLGRKHDNGWRRVCMALGGSGKTYHNELVYYQKGQTYEYISTIGTRVHISSRIHRNIQAGREYNLKLGGKINKDSVFKLVAVNGVKVNDNAQVNTEDNTQVKVNTQTSMQPRFDVKKYKTLTAVVREYIKYAIQNNQEPNYVMKIIQQELDMDRNKARSYVKTQWVRASLELGHQAK